MSTSDGGSRQKPVKASILPQYVEFTPEIEAALDEEWAQIADELQGAPFETDDNEGEHEGGEGE